MKEDDHFMKRALALARRGRGKTSPNPMVGAVVVKVGRVVGEGWHRRAGFAHAETVALDRAGEKARGATLYVNLEPCRHWGRTPPCVDAIEKSGVRRVVAAMLDPDPRNDGRGIERLKRAGIRTTVGVREEEARRLNEAFVKFARRGLPFVTVKAAQSLDGKIATTAGKSKWITGDRARDYGHRLRAESDAVIVGVNTVLTDDPRLSARPGGKPAARQPLRVILDSRLRTPPAARIFSVPGDGKALIAAGRVRNRRKRRRLEAAGAEIVAVPDRHGRVSLTKLLRLLAARGVTRVLIEGGGGAIAAAFREKLVDRVLFFVAPAIIGGREAPTAVEGEGIRDPGRAIRLREMKVRKLGNDRLFEARVEYP